MSVVPSVEDQIRTGYAAHQAGDRATAARCYQDALAQAGEHPNALNLMATLLVEDQRFDHARPLVDRALRVEPRHPFALMNRCAIHRAAGDTARALGDAEAVLALLPGDVRALHNLANLRLDCGDATGAITLLDEALARDPAHAEARLSRAMAALALGRWQQGWQDMEARWQTQTFQAYPPALRNPGWDGQSVAAPLVLIAEQGFGDALQFIRYASALKHRAPERILAAHPALHRLLGRVDGIDRVQNLTTPLPRGSVTVGLMSLPRLIEPVPRPRPPYLTAEAQAVADWSRRVPTDGRPRVGLCWHGMARPDQPLALQIDRRRSLAWNEAQPLLGLDHLAWVSLQTDAADDMIDALLPSVADGLVDFAATAALVAMLDLVVTVDTAIAHLAGGLGRPTLLLNRSAGCWRWGLDPDQTTTPWYPSMRVVTQRVHETWDQVVARVIRGLAAWRPGDPLPECRP